MDYITINNRNEQSDITSQIHSSDFHPNSVITEFISDKNNVIYARFDFEYFIFGKTITPNEIEDIPDKTENNDSPINIFKFLRKYGSSKKYKGVINCKGEITLQNIFTSIEPFWNELVKVRRGDKYGIYHLNGKVICNVEYDEIFEVSEFVFAARKEDKIGFINIEGKIVIPFEYESYEKYTDNQKKWTVPVIPPKFVNGLVCVSQEDYYGALYYGYIDHYGNTIFPFIFGDYIEFNEKYIENNSFEKYARKKYRIGLDGSMKCIETEFYENEDDDFNIRDYEASLGSSYSNNDYDMLDAYEGDYSNIWNTD